MVTLLFLLFLASLLGGLAVSVVQSVKATVEHVVIKYIPAILGLIPATIFLCLFLGAYSVDAGSIGVVKRFGNPIGMLKPGLHFVRPVGDTVTEVAVQRRIVKVAEPASSSDMQIVNIEVTLGYHIDPAYADFALVQLNNDAEERVIRPANLEAIKAQTSKYEAQGLIKQRELVRAGIENDVRGRLSVQHVILEDMAITNFSFSSAYENAIEQKQVAEQNAEKAKNLLEQAKIEAETVAATAKGAADARRAQAEGEASAILVEAQAKAKAQELQKQSLTPELLELRRIEMWDKNWKGDVPQFVGAGGSNFLMQIPSPQKKANKEDAN